MPPIREARLRPEFSALYPDIPAGQWMPARELSDLLLSRRVIAPPPIEVPPEGVRQRVLSDEHFEFRDRP